jgi:hypothetical protein
MIKIGPSNYMEDGTCLADFELKIIDNLLFYNLSDSTKYPCYYFLGYQYNINNEWLNVNGKQEKKPN